MINNLAAQLISDLNLLNCSLRLFFMYDCYVILTVDILTVDILTDVAKIVDILTVDILTVDILTGYRL